MPRRLTRRLAATALLLTFFHTSSIACGPFTLEAVFVFTVHPAYPLDQFARGRIGVLQPSYARSYLYVAYRYLSDSPFTTEEQKALTELWNIRLNGNSDLGDESWIKTWLDARQRVPGLPEPPKIQVFRNREKPNEYETYLNCAKDSFDNAVATLAVRIKRQGAENPATRAWIEAQDLVFANCGEGQHIPEPLGPTEDSRAQADRNYQIAAAQFYSTNFDAALKSFESIANDSSSPWSNIAPYLRSRALVRKASLGPDEAKKQVLTEAETQLNKILAEKKFSSTHEASRRLLDLVRLRLHPAERMHELAETLINKKTNGHLKQDLWDYTVLLDAGLDSSNSSVQIDKTDELTDWLLTLQGNKSADADHAVAKWRSTHAVTWLTAALSKVDGKHAATSELIKDALNVKPSTVAFASARFHAVRLLMESGKLTEARSVLDQVLKNNRNQFDSSSLNLLISQRMMLSTSLGDFLSYAPRIPAALSWNDDGREIPSDAADVSDEHKALIGKPLFDQNAGDVLNKKLPLFLLKEAAMSESLPTHIRRDLAQATWIRAVLLGDFQTADQVNPVLKNLVPGLTESLDDFARTTAADAKRFSAIYTWLKFPGLEPVVDIGIGREKQLSEQDTYRDNWWCGASVTVPVATAQEEDAIPSFSGSSIPTPAFLTDAQKAAGANEWKTLSSLGVMPNYLPRQVIQWATKNPADPRVPEALHLAVNATRYGCGDKDTGRWSKAAFDLLHRKYPNTTWAKKTKYWFKE